MDQTHLHERARTRGVNPIVYWIARAFLQPFAHVYWRLSRIGREHIPASGPVILASNHRSFLDPFLIGLTTRRPVYYVAKQEIFAYRPVAWLLSSLGAFPVRRGAADADMIETAKAILARGEVVLIFPEGTRTRPGTLGKPKRGVGRLALETGATVVPLAVIGTEAVRNGWRIRPHKVRIRVGAPLRFPLVESATRPVAAEATDRIWPNVMLLWEWLGGEPPVRRAAVIGDGAWGTAIAVLLARAGIDVELGCATRPQAELMAGAAANERHLPGVELPARVRPVVAGELELCRHDVVVFAVPATELPAVVAAHAAGIAPRTAVLSCSTGLVPPSGALPSERLAELGIAGVLAAAGAPADLLADGATLTVAARDAVLARRIAAALKGTRVRVDVSTDVAGVQLAAPARDAAALAVGVAAPDAADVVAHTVLAEIGAAGDDHLDGRRG